MYSLINVNNRNKYGIFGGDMFGFTYVRMVKGEWSNTASPQNYTGSGCWTKKKKDPSQEEHENSSAGCENQIVQSTYMHVLCSKNCNLGLRN